MIWLFWNTFVTYQCLRFRYLLFHHFENLYTHCKISCPSYKIGLYFADGLAFFYWYAFLVATLMVNSRVIVRTYIYSKRSQVHTSGTLCDSFFSLRPICISTSQSWIFWRIFLALYKDTTHNASCFAQNEMYVCLSTYFS